MIKPMIYMSLFALMLIMGIKLYILKNEEEIEFLNTKKWSTSFQKENLIIDSNIKLVGMNKDTILLKDIIEQNSIVLCYSFLNCHSCVEKEFNNLSKLKKSAQGKIKILASYENFKKFKIDFDLLKQNDLSKIDFYMLPINGFKIPVESQNRPFYFNIDKDFKMKKVFLPSTEKPDFTVKYLKETSDEFL